MKNTDIGSFASTLFLALFVGLKLEGTIDWSWWWVFSPVWIPLAFVAAMLLFWFIYYAVKRGL